MGFNSGFKGLNTPKLIIQAEITSLNEQNIYSVTAAPTSHVTHSLYLPSGSVSTYEGILQKFTATTIFFKTMTWGRKVQKCAQKCINWTM